MAYTLKTQVSDNNVQDFLYGISDEEKKQDCFKLLDLLEAISGQPAKMWGKNIIGFGSYSYKYTSGQSGDWMKTGFSPRTGGISLYIMPGYQFGNMPELMEKLGKYKSGKSCLNIKKLSDIDLKVLEKIIKLGLEYMNERYPEN